jgi:hypothetical protein
MRKYPHLLKVDVPVWERFLDRYGRDYNHFEYDVRVGLGRDPGPEVGNTIRQMALDLSLRRIDAVGHRADGIHVIEITTSAGMTAVGQLSSYPTLYRDTFHPTKPITPLLVAEMLQSDIETALNAANIPFVLV